MPKWLRDLGRGLILFSLSILIFIGFRSFSEDNPYQRDVNILLITKTIEERDAYVDLIIERKEFKRVDVHAIDEQKNLRFSKYELIVLPAGLQGLKERLTKYYDTGAGIFVYGGATAKDLNAFFGLAGDGEDFLVLGTGEGSMAKLGKMKAARLGEGTEDYSFDIVGRYKEPGSYIRVDLGASDDYHYRLLRAITDVHSDTKLRTFGNKSPSRLSFYSYLGDGTTLIREFLSLYRDYSYEVHGYFRFKLISELEVRTKEGLLDEIGYRVNTNEYASVMDINPKRAEGVRAEVDKGREEAKYSFTASGLFPRNLSGSVHHSSQFFQITTEALKLSTEVEPKIYYGSFNQYQRYPKEAAKRRYAIEVLF